MSICFSRYQEHQVFASSANQVQIPAGMNLNLQIYCYDLRRPEIVLKMQQSVVNTRVAKEEINQISACSDAALIVSAADSGEVSLMDISGEPPLKVTRTLTKGHTNVQLLLLFYFYNHSLDMFFC